MIYSSIKENQTLVVGLLVSIIAHALLFVFSKNNFIQNAHYSVRVSDQMVEVSMNVRKSDVIDTKEFSTQSLKKIASSPSAPRKDTDGATTKKVPLKPFDTGQKAVARCITGVKIKADPDYFQNPPPEYPELARQMRQEGIVMLSVDVNKEGDPINVGITQSSGFRLLDQAALKAVRHWKFKPGSVDNIMVESRAYVPIRFKLEE